MSTMNVSMPEPMKKWVEEQVATGRYASTSDFMRDLVRRAIAREEAIARLNALIQEGIDSGPAEPFDFETFRAEVRESVKTNA